MRIVLVRSNPVSPDPPVEKVADYLTKLGHNVTIIGWDRSDNYDIKNQTIELLSGVVNIYRFGIPAAFGEGFRSNLMPLLKFQKRLLVWLIKNRRQYDTIHAYDFDTALVSYICSKLYSKKLVYHILDYYVDCHVINNTLLKGMIARIDNHVINHVNAVIICTEKRKKQLEKSSPKKLYVIHNTPDLPKPYKGEFTILGSRNLFRIVYVGVLLDNRFIKETAEIVSRNPNYEFHIGGYGQLGSVLKEFSEKNENIYFYGKLDYCETLLLESLCDVMIAIYDPAVPNPFYAAPNKFYEALMLGKPVVMAKNTGVDDVVSANGIGKVIDFTKESLEQALRELCEDKESWKDISRREKELYNERYSWEIMGRRINEIYSDL